MLSQRVAEKTSSEDLLKEVEEASRNLEELLAYHSDVLKQGREGRRWAQLKWQFRHLMLRRQIERHVLYWRLQHQIAEDAYKKLRDIEQKKAG